MRASWAIGRKWIGPLLLVLAGATHVRLVAAAEVDEDWPRFLGPRANNISSATGLLDKWPTNGLPLVWERRIGSGYSAPSVLKQRLVLHHRLANEEIVEALEAPTGRSLWRFVYHSGFVDPFGYNNGPRCTPLLTTNRCYTIGAEGKLNCLDLSTG